MSRCSHRRSQDGRSVDFKNDEERSKIERRASQITRRERRDSHIGDAIESPLQEEDRFVDAESLFSIQAPPDEVEVEEGAASSLDEKDTPKVYPPLAYPVITSLIPGSIFGVLARLGVVAITSYDQEAILPLAWDLASGCLLIGLASGLRDQIGAHYGPVYTAIATGFCGSLTPLSGWQFAIFSSWANLGHAQRDWFRDIIDGLAKTIFDLAISLSAVTLGFHLSRIVSRHLPHVRQASLFTRYSFRVVSVLMYIATIPAFVAASPSYRHKATAALLFSFPGILTRYILSTTLTARLHLFPLGTFVANVVGTALLGIFHVLQRTPKLPSPNVATFAVEVQALRTRRAWLYVALSWSISQLLLLVILGSAWWGASLDDSRVCTFA